MKDCLESLATLGNRRSLRFVKFACDYSVSFANRKVYTRTPSLAGKTFIQLYVWTKKRPESRAALGNRRSLRFVKFACDSTVPFTNARVESHEAGAARGKNPRDLWIFG